MTNEELDYNIMKSNSNIEDEISYQGMKISIYDDMNAQNPDVNPITYGSHFAIDYNMLLHDPEDVELMQAFIACGLFELEHEDLEERIEEQMTYWIYQYEHFNQFKDIIPDYEIMEKDIKKIKSMINLRFEDLACYEDNNAK